MTSCSQPLGTVTPPETPKVFGEDRCTRAMETADRLRAAMGRRGDELGLS